MQPSSHAPTDQAHAQGNTKQDRDLNNVLIPPPHCQRFLLARHLRLIAFSAACCLWRRQWKLYYFA